MKQHIRCKACGFIMEKDNAPEICPACGVSNKAFEDYKYNLSHRRKFIMEMDLHPIMLHLPQAVSGIILFFGILSITTGASWGIKFLFTVETMTYLLPVSVFATIISGMFDGRNRFKKLTTPALKKKILLASVLQVITVFMPLLVFNLGIKEALFPIMGLSIITLAIQAVLSRIGIKLIFAWLPG